VLKPKLTALAAKLKDAGDGPLDNALVARLNDRVLLGAMQTNHALSMIVMLIMVVKPSLTASLVLLLVAPAFGALTARR
jgi:hypothetical protein